jgi:hypothetical protein
MAFVLYYNAALQVLAAFMIFLIGYVAFFAFLIICLLLATGLYEGTKRIRAYALAFAAAGNSNFYLDWVIDRWWGIGNFLLKQTGGSR